MKLAYFSMFVTGYIAIVSLASGTIEWYSSTVALCLLIYIAVIETLRYKTRQQIRKENALSALETLYSMLRRLSKAQRDGAGRR